MNFPAPSPLPYLPLLAPVYPGKGRSDGGQWQPQVLTTMLRYFFRMTLELSSK